MEPIRSPEELEHLFRLLQSQTQPPPGGGERLRFLSWNILADAFVSQQYFPYVQPKHLLYSYRIENIKKAIREKDCDVLCLQEVDSSDSFFQFLIGLGYDYRYRAKGLQGILIAYKTSVLRLVDSRIVDYDMLINGNVDKGQYSKGHGLLMLKVFNQVMQLETKSSRRLVIGNTHLYWDPQYEKVKYHQICSAVSQMYSFADQTDSVVLAGDLNSLPDSNVVRFVQFRQHPMRELCVREDRNYPEMVDRYHEVKTHGMQLANVFNDEDGKYTNYTRDFKGTIDYIFYDFTTLQVTVKQRLPDEKELSREVALPNSEFPSDHVPLVCTLALVSKVI